MKILEFQWNINLSFKFLNMEAHGVRTQLISTTVLRLRRWRSNGLQNDSVVAGSATDVAQLSQKNHPLKITRCHSILDTTAHIWALRLHYNIGPGHCMDGRCSLSSFYQCHGCCLEVSGWGQIWLLLVVVYLQDSISARAAPQNLRTLLARPVDTTHSSGNTKKAENAWC